MAFIPERLQEICDVDVASVRNAGDYHEKLLGASAIVSEVLVTQGTEILGVPVYHKRLRSSSWLSLTGAPEMLGYGATLSLFLRSPYPGKHAELLLSRVQFPTEEEIDVVLADPQLRQQQKPDNSSFVAPYLSDEAGYSEFFDYIISHTKLLIDNCLY